MQTNNPEHMSDITPANKTNATVRNLNAAMQQLRERREEICAFDEISAFDPAPNNALGIRAHAIQELYSKLSVDTLTEYLCGLGYVRSQLIAARDVLNVEGKKKYEAYIGNAVEALSGRFCDLKPCYLNILTDLMNIPFRRSAEKDRREISDSLCLIADFIEKYRYRGTDERYREYGNTIIGGIDTEQLPPMVAGLIIREVSELVDAACRADVLTFVKSGVTHHELWRYTHPEEYAEAYPDSAIPVETWTLEKADIYPPHEGIAQQSLWYGNDIYVDDFIVSLAGGLLYARRPEAPPRKMLARAKSERPKVSGRLSGAYPSKYPS